MRKIKGKKEYDEKEIAKEYIVSSIDKIFNDKI